MICRDRRKLRNVVKMSTNLLTAFAFAFALEVSPISAALLIIYLFLIFSTSGSTTRGLLSIFISFAFCAFAASTFEFVGVNLDKPILIMVILVPTSFFVGLYGRRNYSNLYQHLEDFEVYVALFLCICTFLLRKLTHLSDLGAFALLLPEDNAAWIHAVSGFVRHEQTISSIGGSNYGAGVFISVLIAVMGQITSFGSSSSVPSQLLNTVTNTYVAAILMMIAVGSAYCFLAFYRSNSEIRSRNFFAPAKYVLAGLGLFVCVGKPFIVYGHLSFILAVYVIFASLVGYKLMAPSNALNGIHRQLWVLNFGLLIGFAVGTVWLPLIPIGALLIVLSVIQFVRYFSENIKPNSLFRTSPQILGSLFIAIMVLMQSISQLRVPRGYSVTGLINASGGIMEPKIASYVVALVGLTGIMVSGKVSLFERTLLGLLPLALLGYMGIAFVSYGYGFGYSIKKFSLFIAILGFPLLVAYLLQLSDFFPKKLLPLPLSRHLYQFFISLGELVISRELR